MALWGERGPLWIIIIIIKGTFDLHKLHQKYQAQGTQGQHSKKTQNPLVPTPL
jgi:hypothetical protein